MAPTLVPGTPAPRPEEAASAAVSKDAQPRCSAPKNATDLAHIAEMRGETACRVASARAPSQRAGLRGEAIMVAIAAWPTAALAYQVFFRGLGQFIWLAGGWLTCLLGCVVVKMVPWPHTIESLLAFLTLLVIPVAYRLLRARSLRAAF